MTANTSDAAARAEFGDERALVWALLGTRVGDNRTIVALAEAAGLPWRRLLLRFNPAGALPNVRKGGSLFTLEQASRALIAGPWPDVAITSGKRAVPAALWIKAASGGRTRLIHLGRPQAPLDWFDLVITTSQYGLPPRPNVLVHRFPPTPPPASDPIRDDLAALPRPRLAVILGGDAPPLTLDAAAARAIAADALVRARRSGGSLMVATSPRTSKSAVAALRKALENADAPVRLSTFGDGANDYRGFLAAADGFLVTNDSASMVTEAAITAAPVTLFELPERMTLSLIARRTLHDASIAFPKTRRIRDAVVASGLMRASTDLARFMRCLAADGFLEGGPDMRRHAAAELEQAAKRLRALALPPH